MAKGKRQRKAKLKVLKPSEKACWRYESRYGALAIYVYDNGDLSVERANWLLDAAKRDLLKVEPS